MNSQIQRLGIAGFALVLPAGAGAVDIVIDDFLGGPSVVTVISTAPPEIALGSFVGGGGAPVGGVRDVAVWSYDTGVMSAGFAFGAGGYASFAGPGGGALVWDGIASISDANLNNRLDVDEVDLGLALDLVVDCNDPMIEVRAFADLPGATLDLAFLTDHANYAVYSIALTTLGSFEEYSVPLSSPSLTVGTFDPSDVKAVALFAAAPRDGDVRVDQFLVCCGVPGLADGGAVLGMMGTGFLGLALMRRQVARA